MKKGFTLIELLAVIVVLAILALVVTPIVLNIVENAQRGSDERSLEAYAKVVQSTFYELKMKDPSLTLEDYLSKVDTPSGVSLTYNGSKVVCSERKVVETVSGTQSIELRNCTVDGRGPYDFINGGAGNKNNSNVPAPKSFAEDSWSTIVANVKKGNISKYKVGDTKTVTLTSTDTEIAGTYKVRIANTSTPSECNTEGFSQTACGFVIEFADIISQHKMNPYGEYKGTSYSYGWNKDGWPASSMYSYVNNDIYSALPNEVKTAIIDTYTVSGYGSGDSPNKVSTDKLYLLSTAEIWAQGTSNTINYDTARSVTRQLDYYKNKGVTTNNYSAAIKQYNGSDSWWWLRSAHSYDTSTFYVVGTSGAWYGNDAYRTNGVSPAFRIG